jgi:hypothetical protein
VQLDGCEAEVALERPATDIDQLHAPIGHNNEAAKQYARDHEQVIVAIGITDGPHLAADQPPQPRTEHSAEDESAEPPLRKATDRQNSDRRKRQRHHQADGNDTPSRRQPGADRRPPMLTGDEWVSAHGTNQPSNIG